MLLGRGIQVSNNVNTCSSSGKNDNNVDVGLCFDYDGTTDSRYMNYLSYDYIKKSINAL